LPVLSLFGAAWWLTEPLGDRPTSATPSKPTDEDEPVAPAAKLPLGPPVWPADRLEGDEAKALLLRTTELAVERLEQVNFYTATLRKTERIGGQLGPEQTLALKVRNHPFAIYLKFLAPKPGKEVVYAEGHHDNRVIAHNGDWTRRLVPRLAVAPDSPVALADTRHPVTEAGLLHLARRLLHYRKLDMGDSDAITILDRISGPDGQPRLRSRHIHTANNGARPFCKVEVLYDPQTWIPTQITSFDWPTPEHPGEPELAERYAYDAIHFDAALTNADFDPANPAYAFQRF
jgi:hypothetical protein